VNKDYLNAKQAGEMLCVSRSQIYALAKREYDPLPGKRVGGTLIFVRANIEAWVERQPDIAEGVEVPMTAPLPDNVILMKGRNDVSLQSHRTVA
jgi:predicted DNA-binding transcriptional regulator AlpA